MSEKHPAYVIFGQKPQFLQFFQKAQDRCKPITLKGLWLLWTKVAPIKLAFCWAQNLRNLVSP